MTNFEHGHALIADQEARRFGEQAGGNEGGFYNLPTVSGYGDFYVKRAQSDEHGRVEAYAAALYRLAGVRTPAVSYCSDGHLYSPIVKGEQDMATRMFTDQQWMWKLHQGFIADAWLANWDVFGMGWDNIITDEFGVPVRIDMGGALTFRAMGAPKGDDFGPEVHELDVYRTGRKAIIYGDLDLPSVRLGEDALAAISEYLIRRTAQHFDVDQSVASILLDRQKYIIEHSKGF